MVRRNLQHSSQSRVWTIQDRASPAHSPTYQALGRANAVAWGQGSITPIRVPDPEQYGNFITIDKIRGQKGLPGLSIEFRMTRDLSAVLALARKGCPVDIQVHVGACKDPSDFDLGWEKIHVLEDADLTNYATGPLGAFDADGEAVVNETIDVMGSDYYELKPLTFAESANSQIIQSVIAVAICDSRTCGACGLPSDGCQRIFAIQTPVGASPGLTAELVFTIDGGTTWTETNVSSLPANMAPSALMCVGPYLVVISHDDDSLNYALISEILAGTATWTRITTGIVASGSPNAGLSLGRTQTWIVGDGGYIYFSTDITAGVSTQQAGDLTTEDLGCIDAFDDDNLIVGGTNNAILITSNGGVSWALLTGPAAKAAVEITAIKLLSDSEIILFYADGTAYYSQDTGVNWTQKALPGSLTAIDGVSFATRTVGYLIGRAGAVAKALRTVNGGYSWYVLPESSGLSMPTAVQFNSVVACGDNPNLAWIGGLRANNGDGILIKGS